MEQATHLDIRPSLDGKTVFLTGGLGGIGKACLRVLPAHGANVAFTYTQRWKPDGAPARLVDENQEKLSAHPLDLRQSESIEDALRQAIRRWGRIDILVNNAGVGSETVRAYQASPSLQDSTMLMINAAGTLNVCAAFLRLQGQCADRRQRKIINIASVGGGIQPFPGFRLSDGMSKACVAYMTRQLAAELVHSDVDVFALCPGATDTAMFHASTLDALSAVQRDAFIRNLPKRRLIAPDEIANLVAFLASEYSSPLHGAVIDASMGLGVRPGLVTDCSATPAPLPAPDPVARLRD